MIFHRNLAVEGLHPAHISTRSVANLGTYEIEVIITPVPVPSGGGGGAPRTITPRRYLITVRVRFNGKVYEDTQEVDEHRARVIADFHGIKAFKKDEVMVSVNGVQIVEAKMISVIATKK